MRGCMGVEYAPPATPRKAILINVTCGDLLKAEEKDLIGAFLCVSVSLWLNGSSKFLAAFGGWRKSANWSARSPRCRPGCWAYQRLMILTRLFLTAVRWVMR